MRTIFDVDFAAAGLAEAPAAPAPTEPEPAPAPAPAPTPAHECSEVCTKGMCPRARELYAMATSSEASLAIFAAYAVVSLSHFSTNLLDDLDELEMAELRFKQYLRRLQAAYPGEFSCFSQDSAKEMARVRHGAHGASSCASGRSRVSRAPRETWGDFWQTCGKCVKRRDLFMFPSGSSLRSEFPSSPKKLFRCEDTDAHRLGMGTIARKGSAIVGRMDTRLRESMLGSGI